jgi:hypothetical protein
MKYFNGTLTAERPTMPFEQPTEKEACTDCSEIRCGEGDTCRDCGEPLCARCARVIDRLPMCTACCQIYLDERLERGAYRHSMMQLHDATVAMLKEVA